MTEQETRDFLQILCQMAGRLHGSGSDHTGVPLTASLALRPLLGRQAVATEYVSQSSQGHVVHHEQATIGFDPMGRFAMWVVSSSHPRVQFLPLQKLALEDDGALLGRFASASDNPQQPAPASIAIEWIVQPGGSLQIRHGWGLAGESISNRTSVTVMLDLTAT